MGKKSIQRARAIDFKGLLLLILMGGLINTFPLFNEAYREAFLYAGLLITFIYIAMFNSSVYIIIGICLFFDDLVTEIIKLCEINLPNGVPIFAIALFIIIKRYGLK